MPSEWPPSRVGSAAVLALVVVFAVLVGGAAGSYAGVVASRGFRASLSGRSRCDACGRTLEPYELVPFLSHLALRGRCRTCHVPFGWAPLLWELGGGAAAVAAVLIVVFVGGLFGA